MDGLFLGVFMLGTLISILISKKIYASIRQTSQKPLAGLMAVCVFILIMGLIGAVMLYYHDTQMRRYYPYNSVDSTAIDTSHIDTLNKADASTPGKLPINR